MTNPFKAPLQTVLPVQSDFCQQLQDRYWEIFVGSIFTCCGCRSARTALPVFALVCMVLVCMGCMTSCLTNLVIHIHSNGKWSDGMHVHATQSYARGRTECHTLTRWQAQASSESMHMRGLKLALVVLCFTQHAASQLACEQSGYCSLGQVQPFFGDIYSSTFTLQRSLFIRLVSSERERMQVRVCGKRLKHGAISRK